MIGQVNMNRRMLQVSVAAVVAAVGACATISSPGKSDDAIQADMNYCHADSLSIHNQSVVNCMAGFRDTIKYADGRIAVPQGGAGGTVTANNSPAPAPNTILSPNPPIGAPLGQGNGLGRVPNGQSIAGNRTTVGSLQPAPNNITCSSKDLHDNGPRPNPASPLSRQVSDTDRALLVSQLIQVTNSSLVQTIGGVFGDVPSLDPNSCQNVRETQESINSTKVSVNDINKLDDGEYRAIVTLYIDGKPETQKIGFLQGDDGLSITCYPSDNGSKDCR